MKIHAHAFAASLALLLLAGAIPLAAQNHVALIATGALSGSYSSPTGDEFFENLDVKRTVNPVVELLINPDGRISVGAAFTRMKFNPDTFTSVVVADRFQYLDSSGRLATIDMPGTVFASTTTRTDGEVNALLGLAYVNLVTTGKVRPFIGGGYGIGFAKRDFVTEAFVHPLYAELAGFAFEVPPSHSTDTRVGIVAAKFGVNIYPARHLLIRASGGYLNGGYGEVGVGVVF